MSYYNEYEGYYGERNGYYSHRRGRGRGYYNYSRRGRGYYGNNDRRRRDDESVIDVRNICSYYNNDGGCKFGESCYKMHVKGSVELSRRCLDSVRRDKKYFVLGKIEEGFKKVHIYDFDRTLLNTLTKEKAMKILHENDEEWPFGYSFYGIPESLSFFKDDIKEGLALKDCKKSLEDDEVLTILLTGRGDNCTNIVGELLEKFEINSFKAMIFKPNRWKLGTGWFKVGVICEYIKKELKQIESIDIWEDRLNHLLLMGKHAKGKSDLKVVMHYCDNEKKEIRIVTESEESKNSDNESDKK